MNPETIFRAVYGQVRSSLWACQVVEMKSIAGAIEAQRHAAHWNKVALKAMGITEEDQYYV